MILGFNKSAVFYSILQYLSGAACKNKCFYKEAAYCVKNGLN